MLTPATEVDGREKAVDNFNFALKNPSKPAPGLVYWGQYVQHDNNRDGIGVGLKLTQNILKSFLDWRPQVFHDLHESVTLLYVSTGTGPYNTVVDPIQINEWWLLAQNEMMEMAKRNVPGVWTYNYYDGWVPNYMFWIGVTHNSIGRFYETQSFRGQNYADRRQPEPRVVPAEPDAERHARGARAPTSTCSRAALLISMNNVAKNKELFLENYYLKNKHTIERGQTKAPLRLRDSRGAAAEGRGGGADEPAPPRGRRSAHGERGVHRRQRRGRGRRLHRPHGSAVRRDRRDAARRAVLRAGQPASVRRHRLGDSAGAQRQGRRRSPTSRSSSSR